MVEEEKHLPADYDDHHLQHQHSMQYCSARIMSSTEIVEMGEDHTWRNGTSCREGIGCDVYVVVGKDDLHVLKWALDQAVSPGSRLFLVHVFPPVKYINTPVGRLARSQLSKEQLRFYTNEEHNRRRNLLQKYIRLCNDAKVTVETMLLESNSPAKAILDLISVANITFLVMGTKRTPCSRRLMRKFSKVEYVKKNAPEYCEVTIVHEGKKVVESQKVVVEAELDDLSSTSRTGKCWTRMNLFKCKCLSGKRVS